MEFFAAGVQLAILLHKFHRRLETHLFLLNSFVSSGLIEWLWSGSVHDLLNAYSGYIRSDSWHLWLPKQLDGNEIYILFNNSMFTLANILELQHCTRLWGTFGTCQRFDYQSLLFNPEVEFTKAQNCKKRSSEQKHAESRYQEIVSRWIWRQDNRRIKTLLEFVTKRSRNLFSILGMLVNSWSKILHHETEGMSSRLQSQSYNPRQ